MSVKPDQLDELRDTLNAKEIDGVKMFTIGDHIIVKGKNGERFEGPFSYVRSVIARAADVTSLFRAKNYYDFLRGLVKRDE